MRTQRFLFVAVWLSPCLLVSLSPGLPFCRGAFDPVIGSPMYQDPYLPSPRLEQIFPEKAKALWLKALNRPEADVRRQAAAAVALARRRNDAVLLRFAAGATGLLAAPLGSAPLTAASALIPSRPDVTDLSLFIGPLSQALDQPDQHPAVRLADAQALIALDGGIPLRSCSGTPRRTAGKCAISSNRPWRWDYRPARAAWLERLRDPATPQRSLVLAIQALAVVGEDQAADRLREIVLSEQTAGPIRLEAARALGSLRSDGLEKDAERLAGDASPRGLVGRLTAAALLRHSRGDDAVRLLQRFADDAEPAVAAPAVARLLEIDPDLLAPAVEHLLASPDANLRSYAVDVLFRRPSEARVKLLAERLDDADPDVRVKGAASCKTWPGRRSCGTALSRKGCGCWPGT